MQNLTLAKDYLTRATKRVSAVRALFKEESWADVIREAQELVELALKALLRSHQIEVPRIHDVSGVMAQEKAAFPQTLQKDLPELMAISKSLRRDRELAFYGSEDLTPSEFYSKEDAQEALDKAERVVKLVTPFVK